MVIIVGKIKNTSVYAEFNHQATVGLAENAKSTEYTLNKGTFTDEKIERAVDALKREYGNLEVIRR